MKQITIKQSFGFNLLELMMALAIGGILAAFAVPSYQQMTKNNCLTTSTNNLITSFQQARSEAIKRRSRVTLTANNGTNWEDGWNVTINEDRNGNGVLDTNEDYDGDGALDAAALIRQNTITCGVTTITGTANSFYYNGEGFISSSGSFDVCDDRTAEVGRQISINTIGRPNTNSEYGGCL